MIKSIALQNFKCFKAFKAGDFSRVNLIGGKNNAGKTALLEAFFLFLGFPQNGLARLSVLRYYDSTDPLIDPEELWGSAFYCKNHEQPIALELQHESQINTLTITWQDVFNPVDNPNFQNALAQQQNNQKPFMLNLNPSSKMLLMKYSTGTNTASLEEKRVWQEMIYNGTYFNPLPRDTAPASAIPQRPHIFLRSQLSYLYKEMKMLFERLLENKKEAALIDFLKIVDPRIKSVMAYKNTLMLDIEGPLNRIPLHYMGDGLQRAVLFYLAIANCRDGIVLIDEIENGVHHSVMPRLFTEIQRAAEEFNCQIFITTHSEECIKAALEGFEKHPDDLRHIHLNRIGEDEIISRTYSHRDLKTAIENAWEVR